MQLVRLPEQSHHTGSLGGMILQMGETAEDMQGPISSVHDITHLYEYLVGVRYS